MTRSGRSCRARCSLPVFVAALLAAALLVPGGCGGAASPARSTSAANQTSAAVEGDGDEAARRQAALKRLRARQEAACEQVGEVLFTCAVEDARASLSPEELEKLDADELAPRYKAEFRAGCMGSDMSLRQVEVYEGCVQNKTTCAVFVSCLDAAQPQ